MIQIDASESVTWTASGLVLEARSPFPDRFWVIVRHVGSAPVLWDGEFAGRGQSLDDLPADDFTLEVLARVVRDLSDRLGRLVYSQDELQETLRGIATAIPAPFRA
jgi:hypothetical protein